MRTKDLRIVGAATAWGLLLVVSQTSAAQYSWEVSGAYQQSKASRTSTRLDTTTTNVGAIHYFEPVDDTLGPYEYAAFLNRSTRIAVTLDRDTIHQVAAAPIPVSIELTDRTNSYSVAGRYVWRESGWYIGGAGVRGDGDPGLPGIVDIKQNGYQVSGGKFLGRTTALDVTLGSTTVKTYQESPICITTPCPRFGIDTITDDIAVAIVHLGTVAAMHYAVSGNITASHAEARWQATAGPFFPPPNTVLASLRSRAYTASGELFPTVRLGVRLEYSSFSGDSPQGDTYGLSAGWFFHPNVAVRFSWSRIKLGGGVDQDGAGVRFIGRF